MKQKVEEYGNLRFPSLRKMVETQYVDPRREGKKIYFEKEGTFAKDDRIMKGRYICYKEEAMPSKFVTVFIDEEINEENRNENPVNLIAITGSKEHAMSKVSYRNRVSNRLASS